MVRVVYNGCAACRPCETGKGEIAACLGDQKASEGGQEKHATQAEDALDTRERRKHRKQERKVGEECKHDTYKMFRKTLRRPTEMLLKVTLRPFMETLLQKGGLPQFQGQVGLSQTPEWFGRRKLCSSEAVQAYPAQEIDTQQEHTLPVPPNYNLCASSGRMG